MVLDLKAKCVTDSFRHYPREPGSVKKNVTWKGCPTIACRRSESFERLRPMSDVRLRTLVCANVCFPHFGIDHCGSIFLWWMPGWQNRKAYTGNLSHLQRYLLVRTQRLSRLRVLQSCTPDIIHRSGR